MKIYERLVDSRLREMVPITQVQWGFMPERSTTDAIFIARQVMEKYREKRKPCYLAFLDLEKAYDKLARAVIWNALRGRGVPERLITVIRDMYEGSKAAIRTPHGVTLKGKLYRTVVRPALLYGSECSALHKAQERQLHAAEMRMLRSACGWTRRDRVRNEDVRAVMKTAPIQLKMREQRLRWCGHVLRRPEDHPTRLALDFEAPGKRPRGAPRKRWRDVIRRDVAEIGAAPDIRRY
ncbi:unnamed protein product [Heligmosomoides polygyrus]|uniref:Reverse transcriptase domain-containing protein n=1 Tax=Heligmosomoides polygyrus TaxID=6339 RepID=A0A183GF39_HELPZ|nr:unnamed protein product [Heligmosomoides polygyrus]